MKKTKIPPMLADLVLMTIVACDGILFEEAAACPSCGGELSGYDVKRKQFAVVMEQGKKRVISVRVRRLRCRDCRQITYAGQPFYPDTRIGSPVIDLCRTLGQTMSYGRVASFLAEMGVVVDRWSVRNYVKGTTLSVPAADMFGVRVPLSLVSLSTLAGTLPEGRRMDSRAALAACGYPSKITLTPGKKHLPDVSSGSFGKPGGGDGSSGSGDYGVGQRSSSGTGGE